VRFVDLSVPLQNFASEYNTARITYWDHEDFGRRTASIWGLDPSTYPEPCVGSASEELSLLSHAGTHVDAPWHFGPRSAGRPARTVDEVPLSWCYGPGVVLDVRDKPDGSCIGVGDLRAALDAIEYELRPGDIVCLWTGAGEHWDRPDYCARGSGLVASSVVWLVDQGVRMITTDAFSLDAPIPSMVDRFRQGDTEAFFPANRAGRQVEYVHAEKVVNLGALPPTGFTVALFPVRIRRASGAWCRAVAMVDDDDDATDDADAAGVTAADDADRERRPSGGTGPTRSGGPDAAAP